MAAKKDQEQARTSKLKAFDDALKTMNKGITSSSGNLISKFSDLKDSLNVETFSTGSLVLDSISGGGLAKGRIIEIYGAESSGKTTIALTCAADVQKKGGTVAFIDFEYALDPKYARKLGVDVPNMAIAQPDYAEQGLELVEGLAGTGAVDLIIIDSVAALVPKAELEGDLEQQTMALVARLMSRSLKKLVATAGQMGTTIIFINQTRDNIGGFSPRGTPQTTTGGKALKFFASQRIQVRKAQTVMEKGNKSPIGNVIKFKIVKNKIAPPFLEGESVITFNKGINRTAEMIEVGAQYGVIARPNSRKYVERATGEVIGNSKADAIQALTDDPEMLERLSKALQASIEKSIETGVMDDFEDEPKEGEDGSEEDTEEDTEENED